MAVSEYVVAAITGCWYEESHVNPAIWESLKVCDWDYQYEYKSKGGYGFGQWTNVGTKHGRLYKMHQWMTSNGYDMTSGEGECAYLLEENYWDHNLDISTYPTLSSFLRSTSTDVEHLTEVFLANWEGVPGNKLKLRKGNALRFLQYIKQNKNKTGFKWYHGNTYDLGGGYANLSASGYGSVQYSKRTLSNVMMVYFYFNNITPEPIPEGNYNITIVIEGNGTAYADLGDDVPITYAPEGTRIGLAYHALGDDSFEGFSVESGGIQIDDYHFTMPSNDVIIKAKFTGSTPVNPDPSVPSTKVRNKMIYYIPWWSKYGL